MVNHYSKRLPSTVIQGVYKITKLDKEIGIFWWFVSNIVERAKSKTRHEQLIINGYKHWW